MEIVRPSTDRLRQSTHLKARLRVILGLVAKTEIETVREDWQERAIAYCSVHAGTRLTESPGPTGAYISVPRW